MFLFAGCSLLAQALPGQGEALLERGDRMPPRELEVPGDKLPWPFPGDFADQRLWNNYQQASESYVHAGLDLVQEVGTEVRAVDDGWVSLIATNYPDWTTHHFMVVATEEGGDVGWSYIHMDPATYTVAVGDRVRRGQVIGKVGDFRLGDRDGADHLHLEYVRFSTKPNDEGEWTPVDLMDPLWFFDAPDDRDPEVAPLRLVRDDTWEAMDRDERGVWSVDGKVDVIAAIRDQSHSKGAGNWGVPGVTLEIEGQGTKWAKLVLDHRGPLGNERITRPLYEFGNEVDAWKKELRNDPDLGPWPTWQVLRVTHSDGDGLIENADAGFSWDTTALDAEGRSLFPDGTYRVTVRAFDLAGNVGVARAEARVKNGS